MLKLYGPLNPRAINTMKIRAAMEEIGAPYEYHPVDLGAGEHRHTEFMALNPHAKVPVLVDGDFVLPESDAILWYLAERFPAAHLLPSEPEGRAQTLRWMDFGSTTLYPAQSDLFLERQAAAAQSVPSAPTVRRGPAAESPAERLERAYRVLEGVLSDRSTLTGSFSIADLGVTAAMEAIRTRLGFDNAKYPQITAYLTRITARPAWVRMLAKG